jgi:hypothetical protein
MQHGREQQRCHYNQREQQQQQQRHALPAAEVWRNVAASRMLAVVCMLRYACCSMLAVVCLL